MSIDWAGVYRATYPELVRYLYRKLWDAERSHELAQETFVRALDRDPEDARGWLFTVAGNLARDELRKVIRRRRHLALIRAETDPADPEPDALRRIEERENRERARIALESLPERDREALLLREAGLSYAEIAERTGLAPGAVGTTLSRARRRLATAYHSSEEASEEADVARG